MKAGLFAFLLMAVVFVGLFHAGKPAPPPDRRVVVNGRVYTGVKKNLFQHSVFRDLISRSPGVKAYYAQRPAPPIPDEAPQSKCRRRRDASGSCLHDSHETEVKQVAIGNDVTGNIFVSAVIRTTGKFEIAAKCAETGNVLSRRRYSMPRIEEPHTFPALHIDGTFFERKLVIQITMPDGDVRSFPYIPKRTLSASLQASFNRQRSTIVGRISFSGNLVDRVYLSLYQSGATTQLVKKFVFFAVDEPNPYALDGKFPPLVPGMTYHLAVDSFLAGRVQTLRYTVQR